MITIRNETGPSSSRNSDGVVNFRSPMLSNLLPTRRVHQTLHKIACHNNVPWDIGKRCPDLSSAPKTLSFGEKIAKIGPVDPEIICLREIIKKKMKTPQAPQYTVPVVNVITAIFSPHLVQFKLGYYRNVVIVGFRGLYHKGPLCLKSCIIMHFRYDDIMLYPNLATDGLPDTFIVYSTDHTHKSGQSNNHITVYSNSHNQWICLNKPFVTSKIKHAQKWAKVHQKILGDATP